MHLAHGSIWWVVAGVGLLLIGLIINAQLRRVRLVKRIFSPAQESLLLNNYSPPVRNIRLIALILGLLLVGFCLLDPRWGSKSTERQMEGIDVVMVMDISRSMDTPDAVPSRLEFSRKLSKQLMSLLIGNRIGLVAFAGFATPVIPLTTDINAAMMFLDELSTGMIDIQGTNLEDAIREALGLFDKEALTHKAIVIFTDGEDTEFSPEKQVRMAKEQGVAIFTVGIGTPKGGTIPLRDEQGEVVGFLEDGGTQVISRLDRPLLEKMAQETGGMFVMGDESTVIQMADKLDKIKKSKFGSNMYEYMEPQYQFFLLAGILLLLIYFWLPDRRLRNTGLAGKLAMVLLLMLPLGQVHASARKDAADGVKKYRDGDFTNALKLFQKAITQSPTDEKLRFNEGNSYYQLGEKERAASSYLALTNSRRKDVQQKSWYNLGNSLLEGNDVGGALQAYKKVLDNADPNSELFRKALNNFLYAKQQIKNQSSSQQSQQQSQQNQDKNQDKKDKDQNQDKQQPQDKDQQKNQPQNQDQQKQQPEVKPISPSQIENLLNLIEEEEKKHLQQNKKEKGIRVSPRQKW